jgi:hypothetical protein
VRDTIKEWTKQRGKSPRTYPGALVWCVKKPGNDLLDKAELSLAWGKVAVEIADGTLGGEYDRSDRAGVASRVADANDALKDEVWAGYRFVIVTDGGEAEGLKVVDLGAGHVSGGDRQLRRLMKRFARTPRADDYFLFRAKLLTYGWGLLSILLALAFVQASYAQILWGKLMGLCTSGVLAIQVLALLPVRINKWAVGAGVVTGYGALFLMIRNNVNFLLWPVIGNLVCFLVALLGSRLRNTAAGSEPNRPDSR